MGQSGVTAPPSAAGSATAPAPAAPTIGGQSGAGPTGGAPSPPAAANPPAPEPAGSAGQAGAAPGAPANTGSRAPGPAAAAPSPRATGTGPAATAAPAGPAIGRVAHYTLFHSGAACPKGQPCLAWTAHDQGSGARFAAAADLRPLHLGRRLAHAVWAGQVTLYVDGVAETRTQAGSSYTVVRAIKLVGSVPLHPTR